MTELGIEKQAKDANTSNDERTYLVVQIETQVFPIAYHPLAAAAAAMFHCILPRLFSTFFVFHFFVKTKNSKSFRDLQQSFFIHSHRHVRM